MQNLTCQCCGRTYEETLKYNIGFYCDSSGNVLCFTCKDIKENSDTSLAELISFKKKWEKLRDAIGREKMQNESLGTTFASIEDENILRIMREIEKEKTYDTVHTDNSNV